MRGTVKTLAVLAITLAACDAFTPKIDPAPYPCHDPQSQWCDVQQTSCCKVWEACQPHGLCENQGFTAARLADGGVDGGP